MTIERQDEIDPRQRAREEGSGYGQYAARVAIHGPDPVERSVRPRPRYGVVHEVSDRDVAIAQEMTQADTGFQQLTIPGLAGAEQASAHEVADAARRAGNIRRHEDHLDARDIARAARRARRRGEFEA